MDSEAKQILDKLKARKYDPVYVLQGEETYYIDLISNYIEANVLSESEKSFNQVVVYGKDVTVSAILTHARRFPMMAERQVVIVKEAQEILDLQREGGAKMLLSYLQQPVPSTVLVFCHKYKTFDKRKELGKKLDQLTVCATFKKPKDERLGEFIVEHAKSRGYKVDADAIQVLAEYVGNDLSRLANEIDKVAINSKPETPITAELVMAHVGISKEYNVFELQKAMVHKDFNKVAKITTYFENHIKRNPAIPMVAFLYSFFSKVLVAHASADKSESGIAAAIKINRYFAGDYITAIRNFPLHKVLESITLLKQADLKLKGVDSASVSEGMLFKELVLRIMI
ncbi:MAG: DNA polymerase III subunit delta [Cyclobacteriaceae bacterium]|nr:DNA polymerase III subunit delta [Cyclobacteriaceae bacterium]